MAREFEIQMTKMAAAWTLDVPTKPGLYAVIDKWHHPQHGMIVDHETWLLRNDGTWFYWECNDPKGRGRWYIGGKHEKDGAEGETLFSALPPTMTMCVEGLDVTPRRIVDEPRSS